MVSSDSVSAPSEHDDDLAHSHSDASSGEEAGPSDRSLSQPRMLVSQLKNELDVISKVMLFWLKCT